MGWMWRQKYGNDSTQVTGMVCEACISHVTKALQNVAGHSPGRMRQATVDLQSGNAMVQHENDSIQAMVAAISEAGYAVQALPCDLSTAV